MWMHEEMYGDLRKANDYATSFSSKADIDLMHIVPVDEHSNYRFWFNRIVQGVLSSGEKDRTITRFLIETPKLGMNDVTKVIMGLLQRETTIPLGISTLRDLVQYRQTVKKECFDLLIKQTLEKDKRIRQAAVLSAKKLSETNVEVERIAVGHLESLTKPFHEVEQNTNGVDEVVNGVEEVEGTGEEKDVVDEKGWTAEDVTRYLDLFCILSQRKHDLLDECVGFLSFRLLFLTFHFVASSVSSRNVHGKHRIQSRNTYNLSSSPSRTHPSFLNCSK